MCWLIGKVLFRGWRGKKKRFKFLFFFLSGKQWGWGNSRGTRWVFAVSLKSHPCCSQTSEQAKKSLWTLKNNGSCRVPVVACCTQADSARQPQGVKGKMAAAFVSVPPCLLVELVAMQRCVGWASEGANNLLLGCNGGVLYSHYKDTLSPSPSLSPSLLLSFSDAVYL